MKHRTVRLLFLLTALFLVGESRARAEMIDFSYSWTALPSSVIPGGTGSATFAVAPDGIASAELGSPTPVLVPGASITTTSSATNPPDSFRTSFSLKLRLTDSTSGQAGDLTFSGSLVGTLTATESQLVSTFTDPLTQSLTLGNHLYSVTIDPTLINLPNPGSSAPALIDARVSVANTTVAKTPEPSSLVLGATAVLGLAARRALARRRRAA